MRDMDEYQAYQKLLKERLNPFALECSSFDVPDLKSEIQRLYELIKDGVTFKNSVSVLIMGPRGAGKTTIINRALSQCQNESDLEANFITIKLSGFIHTTDLLAAREIINQLKLNVDEKHLESDFSSGVLFQLLQKIKETKKQNNLVTVFVLEEFDLFAGHRNQLLLYNLMDLFHSKEFSIVLIGTTCRLDVVELLEKRVKSRLSLQKIYLFTKRSFESYVQLFKSLLSIPDKVISKSFTTKWNKSVLAASKNNSVTEILRKLYFISPDVRQLQQFLMMVLSLKSPESVLEPKDFNQVYEHSSLDQHQIILQGLSAVEMCLVKKTIHCACIS